MEVITYIIWLAVIGIVVGAVARLLVPGRQSMGLVETALSISCRAADGDAACSATEPVI
jgi:hypothetical protein